MQKSSLSSCRVLYAVNRLMQDKKKNPVNAYPFVSWWKGYTIIINYKYLSLRVFTGT